MSVQPSFDTKTSVMMDLIESIIEYRVHQEVYTVVQQYILAMAIQKYLEELKTLAKAA